MLFFPALIIISGVILSVFISVNYQNILLSAFADKAKISMKKVVSDIDSDSFSVVADAVNKSDGSDTSKEQIMKMPEYTSIQKNIADFREVAGFQFLFTMIEKSDKKYAYVVDGGDINSNDFSYPGDIEEEVNEGAKEVYKTTIETKGELSFSKD